MPDGTWSPDLLTHVVNVHWEEGEADQQGLLAEYPPGPGAPEFESIHDVMKGNPTAYALDSDISFPGVNMGASGLDFTVLTKGLVCFGKPRDGDECFIAAPGFQYYSNGGSDALKRGIPNEGGDALIWSATGVGSSGKLIALSFAGDAFFAVYRKEGGGSFISISFDGEHWTSNLAFSNEESIGGAVSAVSRERATGEEEGEKFLYVACGEIAQERKDFSNFVSNLTWATSDDGVKWDAGSNQGEMAEPGTNYGIISNYACTVASGPVVVEDEDGHEETKNIFVAPAATKTSIVDNPDVRPFAMLTAAAAASITGKSWNLTAVGLPAGLDQFSWGLAAIYCRAKEAKDGYFLMSDHELISGEEGHAAPNGNLYKSSDGKTWTKIRTNTNWMSTLSAIAKDLSETTIVHI